MSTRKGRPSRSMPLDLLQTLRPSPDTTSANAVPALSPIRLALVLAQLALVLAPGHRGRRRVLFVGRHRARTIVARWLRQGQDRDKVRDGVRVSQWSFDQLSLHCSVSIVKLTIRIHHRSFTIVRHNTHHAWVGGGGGVIQPQRQGGSSPSASPCGHVFRGILAHHGPPNILSYPLDDPSSLLLVTLSS